MVNDEGSLFLGEWLARGFAAFKRDPLPLAGASAVMTAFSFACVLLEQKGAGFTGLLLQVLVGPVLYVGWCYLCLRQARGEETLVTDVFCAFRRFGTALLTVALYSLIVLAGVLLLVVPGIYWGCKFGLCFFPVMEGRPQTPLETVRLSGVITKGHVGMIFCLALLSFGLSLIEQPFYGGLGLGIFPSEPDASLALFGLLPFLVNRLVIVPWLGATLAVAYEGLSSAFLAAPSSERKEP